VFFHLLLKANHKSKSYRGVTIEMGQVMTGLQLLASETKLSVQKIRTSLERLKSTNEITIKTSSQGTIIQVVKYKEYQLSTNEITNEQQTDNKPITTNKNVNNVKNEKNNIITREADFKKSLHPFLEKFGSDILNGFYLYWSEKNPNGKKMKFEMQKTFDISRRLTKWKANDIKFKNDKNGNTEKRVQLSEITNEFREENPNI